MDTTRNTRNKISIRKNSRKILGIIETITREKHWHDLQNERIIQHLKKIHGQGETMNEDNRDISCGICYLVEEGIGNDKDFMTFWDWYRNYLPAISFSGITVDIFR